MWSLGIVAHYALYGTNPYFDVITKRNAKSAYLSSVCMEKAKWKALGPKLKCGG